ncbi:MAG TPA: hypothetical protein VMU54_00980 [Planctomycetota bacterium]|nr:hypothetical protein [Planctomycetota bacterium]
MRTWALAVLMAIPAGAQDGDSHRPIFVAVGYGGRRASSADGIHWENDQELVSSGGDDWTLLCDVAFGKGVFVAVGGGDNYAPYQVTRDGKTWKEIRPGWKGRIGHIAFGKGRFVAGGGTFSISEDGEHWKLGAKIPFAKGLHLRHIVFGNGVFLGAGDTWSKEAGWYRVVTPDGESVTHFEHNRLPVRGLTFGAGRFVAVQGDGSIESSTDGVNWERPEIELDKGHGSILWTGKQFVVSGGKAALVSPDGRTWTTTSTRIPCSPLVGHDGVFVGGSWKHGLYTSLDAFTWKQSSLSDNGNSFCAAAWGIPEPEGK